MCMCVDIWWIYMVDILILLCSLKTSLSFESWKYFCKRTRAILFIFLLFLGGHLSTHCFQYLEHFCVHFFLFFFFFYEQLLHSPMPLFCNKTLRDSNKNLEHLFGGCKTYQDVFGVYSQCRSETFLSGSKWNGMFLHLPPMQKQCIFGWCVRDLNFKSMTNLS